MTIQPINNFNIAVYLTPDELSSRSLSAEEKRSFGSRLNELKNYAEEALAAAKETAANAAPAKKAFRQASSRLM